MSLVLQILLGIVIAGGIGVGVYKHHEHTMIQQQPSAMYDDHTATGTIGAQADVHLSAGTTNADLDADLRSIDGQLNATNTSSADIDSSMNDKPINQ